MAFYYPLTPGLLISMAIRYDHSFGFDPKYLILNWEKDTVSLADKQIKLIREMKLLYDQVVSHKTYVLSMDRVSFKQVTEEMTGEGFYKPEKEHGYQMAATPEALREAIQLTTDRVSYDGPQPTVTFVDETLDYSKDAAQ